MRRFRRSPALRPIAQGEGRNADLFLADLHGSAVQSDAPSLSNHALSFEELLFDAGRPPHVVPGVPDRRPAGESFPEAWPEAPPTAFPVSEREVPTHSPVRLAAVSAKLQTLDRHLSTRKKRAPPRESWSGEDFVPTSLPGIGVDFDSLIASLFDLENAAIKAGYSFEQRLSAFRKIYYDSGGWDVIIPGAASVKLPASWSGGALLHAMRNVKALDTLDIQGKPTAISHLFAGLDAGNHLVKPLELRFLKIIPVAKISSGKAQATYAGDLGSVCYEYQKARGKVPFAKAARKLDSGVMKKVFTQYVSDADMGGNADAFALALDKSVTVVQNLFDYYTAPPPGGVHLRWYHLMRAIIGGRSSSTVTTELKDDVFSAAEAYAVGLKNDRGYILNLKTKPGPGLVAPTFWEFAMNSAVWTIDEFFTRVEVELDKLQKLLGTTP